MPRKQSDEDRRELILARLKAEPGKEFCASDFSPSVPKMFVLRALTKDFRQPQKPDAPNAIDGIRMRFLYKPEGKLKSPGWWFSWPGIDRRVT